MNSATHVALPRNSRVVFLSLVPGLGHFYLDRFGVGALLFIGFVTSLNGMFLGSTLHSLDNPDLLRNGAAGALLVIWVAGMWHAYRLWSGTDRVALSKQRKDLIRSALIHYLRDELEGARKELRSAVDLDVDWVDPDPLFHLGVILGRLAEHAALRSSREARILRRRAQASFKACLARGGEEKWTREITVELRRLSRKASRRHVNLSSSSSGLSLGGESTDMLPALAQLSQSGEHVSLGKALEREEALPASAASDEPEDAAKADEKRYPSESAAFRQLLFGDGAPAVEVELIDPNEPLPPNRPRSRRLTSRRLAKSRLLERLDSEAEFDALADSEETEARTEGEAEAPLVGEVPAALPFEPEAPAEAEVPAALPFEPETPAEAEAAPPVGEVPAPLPFEPEIPAEAEAAPPVGEVPAALPFEPEIPAEAEAAPPVGEVPASLPFEPEAPAEAEAAPPVGEVPAALPFEPEAPAGAEAAPSIGTEDLSEAETQGFEPIVEADQNEADGSEAGGAEVASAGDTSDAAHASGGRNRGEDAS